jgi:hypothetical protein
MRHVRRFLGVATHSTLMLERNGQWPCDLCHKHRSVTITTVAPVVRGLGKTRAYAEGAPELTVCWRCLFKQMLATLFDRAS